MIEGVILSPLTIVETTGGDVLHGIKSTEHGYAGFGEAYFSRVESGAIKGWKRHHSMVLNLIVPIGAIRFVIYDDRVGSLSMKKYQVVTLSERDNYCRLTIPPMVWLGFQGITNKNILLNIANIEHSPDEIDRKDLEEIEFNWERKQ